MSSAAAGEPDMRQANRYTASLCRSNAAWNSASVTWLVDYYRMTARRIREHNFCIRGRAHESRSIPYRRPARRKLRAARAASCPGLRHRRDRDAGPGHRCEHDHLHDCRWRAAAPLAIRRARSPRDAASELRVSRVHCLLSRVATPEPVRRGHGRVARCAREPDRGAGTSRGPDRPDDVELLQRARYAAASWPHVHRLGTGSRPRGT